MSLREPSRGPVPRRALCPSPALGISNREAPSFATIPKPSFPKCRSAWRGNSRNFRLHPTTAPSELELSPNMRLLLLKTGGRILSGARR